MKLKISQSQQNLQRFIGISQIPDHIAIVQMCRAKHKLMTYASCDDISARDRWNCQFKTILANDLLLFMPYISTTTISRCAAVKDSVGNSLWINRNCCVCLRLRMILLKYS